MRSAKLTAGVIVGCAALLGADRLCAQDWPQWRGPHRDDKVTGFTAPQTWPKELTRKWKVTVGLGDAWPVLAGDKVYAFTREGGDEVIVCLDAGSGKEVWKDKYASPAATGPAGGHPGPRSTPAVADGKICTLGVAGILSCLDANSGKVVWRKDTKAWPMFFTASSPMIVGGNCVAYLGGRDKGEVVAYDLASGDEKWKWSGESPPYGSPILMTVEGTQQLVTPTAKSIVGIGVGDGKLLWQVPFSARYMNNTPIINGETVIYSAPNAGTVALKVEKQDGSFAAKPLWKKEQGPGQYNTPVLKDGLLYGLAQAGGGGGRGGGGRGRGGMGGGATNLFCMSADSGDVLWTDKTNRGECGEVFDAGSVLVALTSDSNLLVFKPSKTGYEELAKYKVADTPTWAGPVLSGNRVFVKDKDSLTLWTIE